MAIVLSMANTVYPFLGGLLLSLAITLNLYLKGRIVNMTSIFQGLIIWDSTTSFRWKSSFVAGLIVSAVLIFDIIGSGTQTVLTLAPPAAYVQGLSLSGWILSGLLVGLGGRLVDGDVAGIIFCGIPRKFRRPIAAGQIILAVAIVIATLNYNYGWVSGSVMTQVTNDIPAMVVANIFLGLGIAALVVNIMKTRFNPEGRFDVILSFAIGGLYAWGLILSGFANRGVVLGFLALSSNWNPALLFAIGGVLLGNFLTFDRTLRRTRPIYNSGYELGSRVLIDTQTIIGSVLFGTGWGLAGICPGPGLIAMALYFPQVILLFITFMIVGALLGGCLVGAGDGSKPGLFKGLMK